MSSIRKAACVALAASALTATTALAQMGGGDGGGSGENDFAIRAELQNPRFIEPGSPYGYNRSYSRGPNQPYPPAYGPPPGAVGGDPFVVPYDGRRRR